MKNAIKSILSVSAGRVGSINSRVRKKRDIKVFNKTFDMIIETNGLNVESAKAQLKQDIVALMINRFKQGGYFVEFGATNGIHLSNTYLLENNFQWNGILAEPSNPWHTDLRKNRNCIIDDRCVWRTTGEQLEFDIVDAGGLSTITEFSDSDNHAKSRKASRREIVESVSLLDLLVQHKAPKVIDYLSVDTEGSEYEILRAFDFSKFKFNFVTIEHNYTDNRNKILHLMEKNGYRRVFERVSRWDDWFVSR